MWSISILAFIFVFLLALRFDDAIIKAVATIRNEVLTEIFLGITLVSSEIIIFFLLTTLFLWKDHKRRWIFPLWASFLISAIASVIMKIGFNRLRPFQEGLVSAPDVLIGSSYHIWNFSFPSFQAMMVFCAIPIMFKEFKKTKWAWVVFAGLVAFSRMYFGMHFLSDVLFGAALGLMIGIAIVKIEQNKNYGKKFSEKTGIKSNKS